MQIEDVRALWRITRVFLLLIPYKICYGQLFGNVFLLQGLRLRVDYKDNVSTCPHPNTCQHITELNSQRICKLDVFNRTGAYDGNGETIVVPAATLTLFNVVFILLALPFVQRFYRFLASHKIKVFTWRRILLGLLLAALSLVAAAVLENRRLQNICDCGFVLQIIDGEVYYSAPGTSLWWQIIQFCLTGAGEVFCNLTAIEYAYMESPRNMQGTVMSLHWFVSGIGSFIGLFLPFLFSQVGIWTDQTDFNCNRLDYVFFILAAVLFLSSIFFGIAGSKCDLNLDKVIIDHLASRGMPSTPQLGRRRQRTVVYRSESNSSRSPSPTTPTAHQPADSNDS